MPRVSQGRTRYTAQRAKVTPPHISVGDFRVALGLTIDEVIDLLADKAGMSGVTRGAISGIENGHRGASEDMLRGLELAYELRSGSISTTYRPRAAGRSDQQAVAS